MLTQIAFALGTRVGGASWRRSPWQPRRASWGSTTSPCAAGGPTGQPWATFLRNHALDIWECDFLPVTDLLFWPVYAFVVVALGSRQVVHIRVTRHPTDAWVARQRREDTPFGRRPRYLLRDNDGKYGRVFTRVAAATGSTELRTAYRAPRQNAIGERSLGSVRRECLEHLQLLGEGHLRRVLREYGRYCNDDQPHQGVAQQVPAAARKVPTSAATGGSVRAIPILDGRHHTYERAT